MIAIAGDAILCRIALKNTGIDTASFTFTRLVSGAALLQANTIFFRRDRKGRGSWLSALAHFYGKSPKDALPNFGKAVAVGSGWACFVPPDSRGPRRHPGAGKY